MDGKMERYRRFTKLFLNPPHLTLSGDQISKDSWRFHSNLGSPVETLAYLLTQRGTTTSRVLVTNRCVGYTYNIYTARRWDPSKIKGAAEHTMKMPI